MVTDIHSIKENQGVNYSVKVSCLHNKSRLKCGKNVAKVESN